MLTPAKSVMHIFVVFAFRAVGKPENLGGQVEIQNLLKRRFCFYSGQNLDEVRLPPCSHGSNGPDFEKYSQRVFYVVCTATFH